MPPNELLKQLDQKVDRLIEEQVRQGAVLEEHQRRSLANETAVDLLRKELKPIALHVAVVGAFGKIVGVIGTVVAIAVGLSKLVGG